LQRSFYEEDVGIIVLNDKKTVERNCHCIALLRSVFVGASLSP